MPPPNRSVIKSNKPAVTKAAPVISDSDQQFEVELYWCIQQLETSLNSNKLSQKQAQDIEKNIKILKSSTQLIIRKRQLMRTLFGDYRSKMVEEEKQLYIANRQVKFSNNSTPSKKSYFVKKSALLQLENEKEFKFNFQLNNLQLNEDSNKVAAVSATEPTEEKSKLILNEETIHFTPSDNTFRFNFKDLQ